VGQITPAPTWTEEFQDWAQQLDRVRPRRLQDSPGWTWLKPGFAQGPLVGGCLESLDHLRGTRFWPEWRGAIFFFETSEEAPPPERVDSLLMDYENMGILPQLAGMIVGRPMRYSENQKKELLEVLLARTKHYDFPIIAGMDFGHTAPQFILPLGCQAEIDRARQRFAILEPAVS
jgi:muramoyltetrapeptide carboxypeptidase LdcA involved in peptidoglycan recycling